MEAINIFYFFRKISDGEIIKNTTDEEPENNTDSEDDSEPDDETRSNFKHEKSICKKLQQSCLSH